MWRSARWSFDLKIGRLMVKGKEVLRLSNPARNPDEMSGGSPVMD